MVKFVFILSQSSILISPADPKRRRAKTNKDSNFIVSKLNIVTIKVTLLPAGVRGKQYQRIDLELKKQR